MKSEGPLIKNHTEIPYLWDDFEEFELYGFPCLRKMIFEEKMDLIITDIKDILDNYFNKTLTQ